MRIRSVGIDLGKTTFHLVALGAAGKVIVRKKFNRKQLLAYTANVPASLIGLEACSGAHFLGHAQARSRCPAYSSSVCKAIREVEQERLHRCRVNRGGRRAEKHPFCPDHDR